LRTAADTTRPALQATGVAAVTSGRFVHVDATFVAGQNWARIGLKPGASESDESL
jgi:hypothetical protein